MAYKKKHGATNGYTKRLVNGAARAEDSPGKPVDILRHISDISQVTGPAHFSKFVPLSGPSRAEMEQEQMKQLNLLPRRNIRNLKLLESDSEEEEQGKRCSGSPEQPFNENAIRAVLKAMYGGREWTNNRYLEERWSKPQEKYNSEVKTKNSKEDEAEANVGRDVFARNVGMRGWRSMQRSENIESAVNTNQSAENVGANSRSFPFVRDTVDPDFASRRFCGVDNEDDFIVEHVGKITSVTPREFLIRNVRDSDFVFSRNNK